MSQGQKQLIGTIGSIVLLLSAFTPMVSVRLFGMTKSQSFLEVQWMIGGIILLVAIVSFICALSREDRGLWILGSTSLAWAVFLFVVFSQKIRPQTPGAHPGWGFFLMLLGSAAILASAALLTKSRKTVQPARPRNGRTFSSGSDHALEDMAVLFDRVKAGIGQGAAKANVKTKEMLETTKIKREMRAFQDQKRSAFRALGNMVYSTFPQDFDEASVHEKCEAIAVLEKQIKQKEKGLTHLQRPAHRRASAPDDQGTFLENGTKAGGIFAQCNCGAAVVEGASFCANCGAKIR